jgi:pyruvate/2-oxoglutarate dehydrogenase complex dihydrolipoamide dehydrogenase (E3) component
LLVCVGRVPNTDGLGLDVSQLAMVNDYFA